QALPGEREQIMRLGFSTVILKPFREVELMKVFRVHSENQELTFEDTLDLSSIRGMCMNDNGLLIDSLKILEKQLEDDFERLKYAVAHKELKSVADICHRLSSGVGQLGYRI